MDIKQDADRSKPDLIVYIPKDRIGPDSLNQHLLVIPTLKGTFLAVWTQASGDEHHDQRVVVSRSTDRGTNWNPPEILDGPEKEKGYQASWGFPFLVPDTGRIYIFYHRKPQTSPRSDTVGDALFRFSDDDGVSWSDKFLFPIRRSEISDPNPDTPPNWITYQTPIINSRGEVMVGFTRSASLSYHSEPHFFKRHSETWFLRFDNILCQDDPTKLEVTTLPEGERGIQVPRPDEPEISIAQEPSIGNLSDGRLICVMRTFTGYIYYSLSGDYGLSWTPAQPLRFGSGGKPIPNPISPCPLYKLRDGRFILIFHNNDGSANGATWIGDGKNRRPLYLSVGREISASGEHPIMFGEPKVLADNDGVPAGPNDLTEIGTYPSLFEFDGKSYFFYPDRKHYLLGKILGDDILE